MKIIDILGWLYNLYPVKKLLRKRSVEYFLKYHISKILKNASKVYVLSEYDNVNKLIDKPPFRGLIKEFLSISDIYPSPKDIAIAINVATHAYCNRAYCNYSNIIDIAYHISAEIKERIISDQILKNIFNDAGKDIHKLCTSSDRAEIEECFNIKKKLFLSYFSSFNNPQFGFAIKVWHQGQDVDWIEWQEKDSIVIHLDPAKIREGFFLPGFDYQIAGTGESIEVATRRDGYEHFNDFNSKDEIIIAR